MARDGNWIVPGGFKAEECKPFDETSRVSAIPARDCNFLDFTHHVVALWLMSLRWMPHALNRSRENSPAAVRAHTGALTYAASSSAATSGTFPVEKYSGLA